MMKLDTATLKAGGTLRNLSSVLGLAVGALVLAGCQALPAATPTPEISAQELRARMDAHVPMLLVFAAKRSYFTGAVIPGAIPSESFREKAPSLAKDTKIVLYCGCPQDEASHHLAAELRAEGFVNVQLLQGGIYSWLNAGYDLAPRAAELTNLTR